MDKKNAVQKLFRILGPGLVTGAADDDPSGIATYSQAGAQFGFAQLWMAIFLLPFMIAIQETCARIGATTGLGIAALVRKNYSPFILYPMVFLTLAANIINISANLAALVAAVQLIYPLNYYLLLFGFSILILLLEIFLNYKIYSKFLTLLCIFLFAYPITLIIIEPSFTEIIKATFIPQIFFDFQFLFMFTAIFGTTISPYLFFWQASQVVEEKKQRRRDGSYLSKQFLRDSRIDTWIGMFISQIISWAIIATTASTLHKQGTFEIITAADAAKALEPLVHSFSHAGYLTKIIFALGIIGSGLLSIPVLAGSAAFACSEAMKFRNGIDKKFRRAQGFYSIIIFAVIGGVFINFFDIDPMRLLVYTAVINGIIAVPLIFIIFLIGNNPKIMKNNKNSIISNIFLLLAFLFMLPVTVSLLFV